MDLKACIESMTKCLKDLQIATEGLLEQVESPRTQQSPEVPPKGAQLDSRSKSSEVQRVVHVSETSREKVVVHISVVFVKIGDIQTTQERFTADVLVQARWREPALDGRGRNVDMELKDASDYWNPKLCIENLISEQKESTAHSVSYNHEGEATVYQRRRVKGQFFEKLELGFYPFDNQDLTVTVSSERSGDELILTGDQSEVSTVNCQSFLQEQEWKLQHHVNTWLNTVPDVFESLTHPSISVSCMATRRYKFFIWNIVVVMMFICGLMFTTFSVNPIKVENRLQMSFVLVLSIINFKFIVNNTLPKVPYLTFLDRYVLMSLGILVLTCVWHGIVAHLTPTDLTLTQVDAIACGVLMGVYAIINIIFFGSLMIMIRKRRHVYKEREVEYRIKQCSNIIEKEKRLREVYINNIEETESRRPSELAEYGSKKTLCSE